MKSPMAWKPVTKSWHLKRNLQKMYHSALMVFIETLTSLYVSILLETILLTIPTKFLNTILCSRQAGVFIAPYSSKLCVLKSKERVRKSSSSFTFYKAGILLFFLHQNLFLWCCLLPKVSSDQAPSPDWGQQSQNPPLPLQQPAKCQLEKRCSFWQWKFCDSLRDLSRPSGNLTTNVF